MSSRPIILSLLLLFPAWIVAQDPADYFHRGVQLYVHAQDDPALAIVIEGLQRFPDDPLLTRLAALIEEKQQQQQQQQQQQADSSQADSDPSQPDPAPNPDETDQPDDAQSDDTDPAEAGEPQPAAEPSTDEPDSDNEAVPEQMTPEQAQRLLETARNDERHWSAAERNRLPSSPQPSGKTW